MENNKDYCVAGTLRFARSVGVRSEVHVLGLASSQDLWYLGGGAFQAGTFGYTGRPSGGHEGLADTWDVSVDCPLRYGFSLTAYYGHAWGKSVIASIYPDGPNANFGYLETNFVF